MENKKQIIRKVFKTNSQGQLFITIPKDSGIKPGDYVSVEVIGGNNGKNQD